MSIPAAHTQAAGIAPEPRDPRAAMPSWINDIRPSVPRLGEEEEQVAKEAIRRRLESSRPDHYPRVTSLHVVPHLQRGTYVFIARVSVAGFSSYCYQLIGHYDQATDTITDLENTRLKPGVDAATCGGTSD